MILDTLAQYGFSATMVQMAIIAAVVIAIIGMFWRIIFAGVVIVSIISVFCTGVFNTPNVSNSNAATVVPSAIISEPVAPVTPSKKDEFMQDCQDKAEFALEICQKIWNSDNE
jgi:hypothetical protein